ncbi:hypothetical protein TWF694_005840 [Orbilia ellipsospora]|uniref:Uncharacterized protein n=1 Tax=Orbilia ellipsospora TaxID=2528407 RepID=A0AAV9WS42_9PEZI
MFSTATTSAIVTLTTEDPATITPSTWPVYAACDQTVGGNGNGAKTRVGGVDRYRSACACIGIQVTTTASVQAVQTVFVPEFNVGLTCGGDSYYLYVDANNVVTAHDFNSLSPPPALFSLDSNGDLLYNGVAVVTSDTQILSPLDASGAAGSSIVCEFQPGGPVFNLVGNCVSGSKSFWSIAGSGPGIHQLYLGTSGSCFIAAAAPGYFAV